MIWINKEPSLNYGVIVESYPNRPVPRRKSEAVSVPGRNGDILFLQDAFENVTQSYDVYVSAPNDKLHNVASRIVQWLMQPGYARLEDSYEPDYFRLAYYSGGIDIENMLDEFGRMTLNFNCRPEKFLKSGEFVITVSNGQTLFNPTAYPAKPLIKVKGSGNGTLVIGGKTITLSGINSFVMLDSEIMNCYKDDQNRNSTMTGDFPVLQGATQISWSGGITGVEITPRWYTI